MARRLPLIVERSVAEVAVTRERLASAFEASLRMMIVDSSTFSCRKGCSNCCYHPVTITIAEGLLLYRWLTSHGKWSPSFRKKAQEASDSLLGLSFAVWLLSAQPCVFLAEDQSCTVHPARPMQCRTTYALGDPDDCHPHKLRPGALVVRAEPLREFTAVEELALKRAGTGHWQVPIATALLFAEKLETGALDMEQLERQLMRTYVETT